MYTYTLIRENADNFIIGTSKIRLPDSQTRKNAEKNGKYGTYSAAFYGALLTLFGPPVDDGVGSEYEYCYVIEASDLDAECWTLLALDGASGPSIRGEKGNNTLIAVAQDLLDLIEPTAPADYTMTVYDDDTETEVTFGCHQGVCFSDPD